MRCALREWSTSNESSPNETTQNTTSPKKHDTTPTHENTTHIPTDEASPKMANLNIRIDDNVKDEVHAYFSSIGITPSEAVRGLYDYIKATKKMPFSKKYLSEEDEHLLKLVKKALADDDEMIDVKPRDLRAALQL